MPYRIEDKELTTITAWPHRSLPRRGFAAFIGATYLMLLIPAFAFLGTVALWGLLPFMMVTLAGTFYFLDRSYRDGAILETLILARAGARLVRQNPRGDEQSWDADPYWIEVALKPQGGPVANYLTLRGNGRTVELGAFLAPEERVSLFSELQGRLAVLRSVSSADP